MMRKIILYIIFAIAGAAVGTAVLPTIWSAVGQGGNKLLAQQWVNGIAGLIIFLILAFIFSKPITKGLSAIDKSIQNVNLTKIIFNVIGGVLGLLIGTLISIPLFFLRVQIISNVLPFMLILAFGYLGLTIFNRRGLDIARTLRRQGKRISADVENDQAVVSSSPAKLLDTSVIIDGRVFDIIKAGFMDGQIIIPNFVILELQTLSDSGDGMKRAKGRRGLDFINEIKGEADITISDKDYKDIREVDTKLLRYAGEIKGKLVTNDFNLNKVAEIQGVKVLNINDLANAVKQQYAVGENFQVTIMRSGSERHQGVGYLPDGTMVVVEDTDSMIDKTVTVEVTKALQTSAGRMIFAEVRK